MPEPRLFNRDLSQLSFNARVLAQAADGSLPLLERIRFLCIFSNNMDEFFMKRLDMLRSRGQGAPRPGEALSPGDVLAAVRSEADRLGVERARLWTQELRPALGREGISLLEWGELKPDEVERANAFFQAEVFPVLTPLAVDPAHPFPFLSNLSLSLGVRLRRPHGTEPLFARIKIPDMLPQWVRIGPERGGPLRLCRLTDLVAANLNSFFPEMTLESTTLFRVLRNAEVEAAAGEVDEDLMDAVEEELRLRRMADIVAVQQPPDADPWFQGILGAELGLKLSDFRACAGELNWQALGELAALPYPHLRFKPWTPLTPPAFSGSDEELFHTLHDQDHLVHLPFESFQASVERLIQAAARDPHTLAIKITMYRLGEDNPLIPLLVEAAENGKQVVCVVELKARFDEARNIYWSEQLEKAGVHVVYGLVGLKTHAKITLVVRRENDGYRFYGHVGTGNYNPATARLYTDFGLFSSDKELTGEMMEIFNYLTGVSLRRDYHRFLLAPVNLRSRVLEFIEAETAHARAGRPARIAAKMNALEDPQIIERLYEASAAGVRVDLLVRGFCCLRPGVPALSENIRVRSILGRFLEHSRAYLFFGGQEDPLEAETYLGSADLMQRNLSYRVETLAPVRDRALRGRIWEALSLYWEDERHSWDLLPDGNYRAPSPDAAGTGAQERLMALARDRSRGVGA